MRTTVFVCSLLLCSVSVAAQKYAMDPAKSTLGFTATQTGADFDGRFDKFRAEVAFADSDLAGSKFDVVVETASVNTTDDDRDSTLRGADLFSVEKFPTGHFVTSSFVRAASGGYEAIGKLTIRDVTRDIRVPFTFQQSTEGGKPVAWLKGGAKLKRLDYGVGQGEWKDTAWVGNDVKVSFSLRLTPAAPAAATPAAAKPASTKPASATPATGEKKPASPPAQSKSH